MCMPTMLMMQVLQTKVASYQEVGGQLIVNEEPFAVLVLTPIMIRGHSLSEAANICFVDSTASCDVENHSITFMLTTCAAGAVPLAVIITASQNEASYCSGFQLLRDCGRSLFGGVNHPHVFLTDDSAAEQAALHDTWSDSMLRLCLFHVAQANLRWLWEAKNGIAKNDRPQLMQEFQLVMRADSVDKAQDQYTTAVTSATAAKYPHWIHRLEVYWSRHEMWCVAWRTAIQRGHHTNNYSEVTVRLFKDIVLSRCKAYNTVALVDFIFTTMENYYCNRLLDFAHSRVPTRRLWLRRQTDKASYVTPNMIEQTAESVFTVQSQSSNDVWHTVDVTLGVCSCHDGISGKFCKHQAAVLVHFPGSVLHKSQLVTETAACCLIQ